MSIATPATQYCNITTDLIRAYGRIYDVLTTRQLAGWTLVSGKTYTYSCGACGYISQTFADSIKLTVKTSVADVESTASTFYYDATNDVLYVHIADGTDPTDHTIEVGVDRVTFLTECRAIAQNRLESLHDLRYPRPLPQARSGGSYLARAYDDDIIQACAKLTCSIAISSFNPTAKDGDDIASKLEAEALKIITAHNEGSARYSWEVTSGKAGQAEIMNYSVAGDGMIEVRGDYLGSYDAIYRIKISTTGALGTAYFKVSTDDGATYGDAVLCAYTWIAMGDGVYVRFDDRGGSFTSDDTWRIYCTAKDSKTTQSRIGNIDLVA